MTPSPRFVWWQHTSGIPLWYVIDTRPPDAEPGQATEVASCRSREAATMLCLSLNGGT